MSLKALVLVTGVVSATCTIYGQKQISYDEMKSFTKGAFEISEFDSYIAADKHIYKVGDTLQIGRPSSNKTFAFVKEGSGLMSPQTNADASISGTKTLIKKIYPAGTKKMGFSIVFQSKGVCGICPNYYITAEQAFATSELQSLGMTREKP